MRVISLCLMVAVTSAWHSPVSASNDAFTGQDLVLAKQCAALIEGDIPRLRKLLDGKPLHALTTYCPGYPRVRFADLALDHLTYENWMAFRGLAATEEQSRLADLALRFVLNDLGHMHQVKPALDLIDQMMDQGALPRDENGKVHWSSVAGVLTVLNLPEPKATADDKAHATRIFLERMLAQLPAERDADLTPLWKGLAYLPEPALLSATSVLKERFGGFNPAPGAASGAAYPLQSADLFSEPELSDKAVLAIADLRLPQTPTIHSWDVVIDHDQLGVLDTFIQRGYPLLQEKDYNGWHSVLVGGVAVFNTRGDTRAFDKMLAVAKPDDLQPEIADRLILMTAFAHPRAPLPELPLAKRWQWVDRLVALGADPSRAFANKVEVRNQFDMYSLIRRQPEVAVGLLDHGLSPTAPVLPSGSNILNNYLMTKRPVPEPEPDIDVIRQILKHKNIINSFDPGVGHFPIEFAVMNHSPEFAKAFYALGVDIHVRDPSGYGLVTRAAANGYTKLLSFLLDAGADANESTPDGVSPLAYAECAKNSEVTELLRQRGGVVKGKPSCGPGK